MRVYIANEAEADLEEIADFIALENPTRAISFVTELRRRAIAIGRGPRIYRIRPELGPDWRVAIHRP